jgi:uncharacterized protein
MEYQWDRRKADSNLRKHGIAFADVVSVFGDDDAITIEDPHPDESRFVAIGMDSLSRVITVVYTLRGESVRIISARRATARERRQYEG